MLGYFQSQEVGVVGAKLLYGDETVQHAGVSMVSYGADHTFLLFPKNAPGYANRAIISQNLSAVTGACQMIRKTVFDEVNGYNEQFAVAFNDVDFCLKVRKAGYYVVFTPYAQLYHYESVSRGRDFYVASSTLRMTREEALLKYYWPEYYTFGDPYRNPAFDRFNPHFLLSE
jgi:GT2 family glycosyltransferase